MIKTSFKNIDELKEFLNQSDFGEVKFCVEPDYIDAVIGISDEGKVIYDYYLMVEHLANIYKNEKDCNDPYTDAAEWIDYNCDMPYFEIVSRLNNISVDELIPELPHIFNKYKNAVIGLNHYGILLIDSEYITEQNVDEIEEMLKDNDIEYKII